jgi:hypothetical protein
MGQKRKASERRDAPPKESRVADQFVKQKKAQRPHDGKLEQKDSLVRFHNKPSCNNVLTF